MFIFPIVSYIYPFIFYDKISDYLENNSYSLAWLVSCVTIYPVTLILGVCLFINLMRFDLSGIIYQEGNITFVGPFNYSVDMSLIRVVPSSVSGLVFLDIIKADGSKKSTAVGFLTPSRDEIIERIEKLKHGVGDTGSNS